MLAQRLAQQSACRLASRQPTFLLTRTTSISIASRFAQPREQQQRLVETASVTSSQANNEILTKQRLNRPVSPHLSIYKAQITWYLSGLNRLTGCVLSGGFYIFGAAYLFAPLLGWHLGSLSMAAAFAKWPVVLKFLTKLIVALPFTFHSFNGLRHLAWDTARTMTNKQVQQTGWAVVGVSVVSALALVVM